MVLTTRDGIVGLSAHGDQRLARDARGDGCRGVCDWSRPGVDQTDTIAWQTYQDPAGSVVYGGRPLGPSPGGSGDGWTSAAFATEAVSTIAAAAIKSF